MSLDMEDHRIRYEASLAAFRETPDDDGADMVLERFMALWIARNGSTAGMGPDIDKLDAECSEAIKAKRGGRP